MDVASGTTRQVTRLADSGPSRALYQPSQTSLTAAQESGKVVALDAAGQTGGNELRRRAGEFVGNVFYGTLIRQMQQSKTKGPFLHGGRGEEVFQAQLGMELAKRMGRSPNDPVANKVYQAMQRGKKSDQELAAEKVRVPRIAPAVTDMGRTLAGGSVAGSDAGSAAGMAGGER